MPLTPEQYLALTQIGYQNFDWPTDQNKTIAQLLTDYALPGEGTPVLAALSSMTGYKLINFQANTSSGFCMLSWVMQFAHNLQHSYFRFMKLELSEDL
ncbi:MAG TPA: hypothetical protein VJ841_02620 [Candidatus Saccharimonadales bacterium]|nr:hypothetical protein [Candidatus Saccharimonadales bacterium]